MVGHFDPFHSPIVRSIILILGTKQDRNQESELDKQTAYLGHVNRKFRDAL